MTLALALLIAATVLLAAATAALVMPWRLDLALEARGGADGRWALAGGAELWGCSASLAAARGAPLVTDVRVLGRTVRRPARSRRARAPAEPTAEDSLRRSYAKVARWVDPLELSAFLVAETGRVSVHDVDGSVRFGLGDVALAGEIAGWLAIASALAAPFGRLRHEIDWSGDEHIEASLSLALRFSPALLLADTVRFALRSVRLTRRESAALPAAPTEGS